LRCERSFHGGSEGGGTMRRRGCHVSKNLYATKASVGNLEDSIGNFLPARQRRDSQNDLEVNFTPFVNFCHFGSSPNGILEHPENACIVLILELT
jgi:hypothetical protein